MDADNPRFLRSYWPVALFVAAWLAVVVFRDPVRVMWWELRLRSADTETQQSYYVNLLSSAGTMAVPAARSLLEDEDAAMRSLGVAVLAPMADETAAALLRSALADSVEQVREMAVIGLAIRRDPAILAELETMVGSQNQETALTAVHAYGEFDCACAVGPLTRAARTHAIGLIRAQAVEELGALRCGEAVPALIDALGDNVQYEGSTRFDELDEQALGIMRKDRAPAEGEPLTLQKFRTVSDQAAFSLRLITGESFGFRSTDDAERRLSAQLAWRNWWILRNRG
jgi:HEAT repeat protein